MRKPNYRHHNLHKIVGDKKRGKKENQYIYNRARKKKDIVINSLFHNCYGTSYPLPMHCDWSGVFLPGGLKSLFLRGHYPGNSACIGLL